MHSAAKDPKARMSVWFNYMATARELSHDERLRIAADVTMATFGVIIGVMAWARRWYKAMDVREAVTNQPGQGRKSVIGRIQEKEPSRLADAVKTIKVGRVAKGGRRRPINVNLKYTPKLSKLARDYNVTNKTLVAGLIRFDPLIMRGVERAKDAFTDVQKALRLQHVIWFLDMVYKHGELWANQIFFMDQKHLRLCTLFNGVQHVLWYFGSYLHKTYSCDPRATGKTLVKGVLSFMSLVCGGVGATPLQYDSHCTSRRDVYIVSAFSAFCSVLL